MYMWFDHGELDFTSTTQQQWDVFDQNSCYIS